MRRKIQTRVHPELLQPVFSTGSQVSFINSYRGVPICHQGHILQITEGTISFSLPRAQLVCIRNDSFTLINSSEFPTLIHAEVLNIDWAEEEIILTNLTFMESTAGKRQLKRVEIETPIPAQLVPAQKNKRIRIEVTELSTGGLSFYVHKAYFKKRDLRLGKKILVHYDLPFPKDKPQKADIFQECAIRNIVAGWGKQYYRIGVQNLAGNNHEKHIREYISLRQQGIMNEISELCKHEIA